MVHESLSECVRVGPAGWSYEDWKGIVYPPDVGRGLHALTFLAEYFDTVEVNASFYRPPNPKHCASWVEKVSGNPNFIFTLKLWERFTHQRETFPTAAEVTRFSESIAPVHAAGKLGAILVQFPWSFRRTPENRVWLGRVFEAFGAFPLSVELRHSTWDVAALYTGLEERNIAFCNIDQPLFNDSIAPSDRVTAPFGYARFHGRNEANWFREGAGRNARYDYLYSEDELKPWLEKLQGMRKKANDLFIVTNNHYRGQAVVNALEIQAALGRVVPRLPAHLVVAYPRLKQLLRD
jgi:uncharacterized protein YecE (DUF72 family)